MLAQLRIKNVAIIESVALPLAPGLNVLSGETGAGKSIIVGALGLLVGERASSDDVRTGSDKATVEGEFHIDDSADVLRALDAHGIEAEGGIVVLKREVAASGRTRAWVNGTPVTAGVLASIGRLLVNIHGQHDAQSLLDETSQREMLDQFALAADAASNVAELHAATQESRAALERRIARRDDAQRRADYLGHVADEVENAALRPGEEDVLASEAARLTHAEELTALTREVGAALDDGDDTISPRLGHLQRALGALQRIDSATERLQGLYDAAFYAVDELAREVAAYAGTIEHDPARLASVEQRRELIYRLSAKHGGSVAKAVEAGRAARTELDALDSAAFDVAALESALAAADSELEAGAAKLTEKRRVGGARLAKAVERLLPELGMPDGRFSVSLRPRDAVGASGAEDIEYRVALNVGHDERPIARIASGGELARVMLALKTILAGVDRVPTLIFDEVDAGIGGAVALMVGDAMRRVGERHQVFAITHLAQIASRAAHHVVVRKGARGGVTSADIAVVEGDARIEELARMLGGDPSSEVSRAHASELLAGGSAVPLGEAETAAVESTGGAGRRRKGSSTTGSARRRG
ncbi:MAG: DNA repair protein RecN [Gemmatimonadetes bacterium]|nr:DNA repair protein RecN [Gemmatimonadota bacterium]